MVMLLLICIFFKADDLSLTGGEIIDFNKGWTITVEEGRVPIEELPYRGESAAGETVILERQIPAEYMGRTLFFLSVEKELLVRVDGTEIYSFGKGDVRRFGRSPGSEFHFVGLPAFGDGYLEIEMKSPYPDIAAGVEGMRLADRDTAILQVFKEKLPAMICSLVLMFAGIFMLVLVRMQRLSGRPARGMGLMGVLLLWAALAYAAETGLLSVLSGGQEIWSYLVYTYIMCAPVLLVMYYMEIGHSEKNRAYQILWGACAAAFVLQMFLELTRIADFFQTVWLSLLLNTVCAVFMIYQMKSRGTVQKISAMQEPQESPGALQQSSQSSSAEEEDRYRQDRQNRIRLEMLALGFVAAGSLADIMMILIRRSAELAVFGRWSVMIYGIFMVWSHVHKIVEGGQADELDKKRLLEQEVERKTRELREIQEQTEKMLSETIEALSNAVDAKDRYTSGHSRRVAEYARTLAERMGLDEAEKKQIYVAGLLHDVGKIRIPDEIINKAGKLTEEEFNYIKLHTIAGNHILQEISSIEGIAAGAKYHHERYDGRGYPNGLEGENIPQTARIIGVADAYDAMASNRSYRKALPQYLVREEIVKGKGTQFDPVIAEHMIALIDEDKDYQMKQTDSLQRTILVVDDEPVNIKIVEYILKDEPMYTILYTYEGHEALKILEEERIDLLLLDIEMSDMNGFEVMEEVRKRNIDVAVAFMSADKDFETIEKANALGVSDYLTKPFLPIELKEIVHGLIEG